MSYGKVSESYWHDDAIRALSEDARHGMLYLISCPHGNRLGLFVLAPAYAAEDLQWETERVSAMLTELRDAGRILWDEANRVVFVRYYLRHNTLANGNVIKGALRDLEALPRTPLIGDLLDSVVDEQKGPAGPVKVHYGELEEDLRRRVGHIGHIRGPAKSSDQENGLDTDVRNRSGNRLPNRSGNRGTRARTRGPSQPSPTLPNLSRPPLSQPGEDELAEGDPPKAQSGEAEINLDEEMSTHLPTARANLLGIRGGEEEPIEIAGHMVGLGVEVNVFKRICAAGVDPPEIVAAAIAHIPHCVTNAEAPFSLAIWNDGETYERCIAAAYKAATSPAPKVKAKRVPRARATGSVVGTEQRKDELRKQVEEGKRQEARP